MNRSVVVRPFDACDLPSILRIERQSFTQDAWPRDVFLEYVSSAPELFLVASVAGKVAGYVVARMDKGAAEIASLAVRPAYREEGVATDLLKTVIKKVRRAGARAVWLMVRQENEKAIRLYRKLGFVRNRTVANYYDDRSSGWRMRIKLDDQPSKSR